jgi:hypothetical protein
VTVPSWYNLRRVAALASPFWSRERSREMHCPDSSVLGPGEVDRTEILEKGWSVKGRTVGRRLTMISGDRDTCRLRQWQWSRSAEKLMIRLTDVISALSKIYTRSILMLSILFQNETKYGRPSQMPKRHRECKLAQCVSSYQVARRSHVSFHLCR